jgi:predicted RNA-binding protein with RPS1 domain
MDPLGVGGQVTVRILKTACQGGLNLSRKSACRKSIHDAHTQMQVCEK